MFDAFFYVGLPYMALIALVVGTAYRAHKLRFTNSALTSQFLESRQLVWGTVAWHVGIIIVLAGHAVAILLPGLWRALTANYVFLVTVEVIGMAAAILALGGLSVLLVRRVISANLQSVTSVMDFVVLGLLLFQVLLGLGVAVAHRWGAVWSTQTVTPYLWSLVTLQPDLSYVTPMPPMMKFHLIAAWVIILLIPFTRLVHIFFFPVGYLMRVPQKVVWVTRRRFEQNVTVRQAEESRRYFLRTAFGLGGAGVLLSLGVFDKLVRFFSGPVMAADEETELLRKKLNRLEQAAKERHLELERLRSEYIHVANLAELSPTEGKYFIDYQMRAALAFRGADGMPLLISAKCTHLGCTVASTMDNQGRILCPCHISYFDVKTGQPNAGSPAKTPLPHIGWVLMDAAGTLVASQRPGGRVEGAVDATKLQEYRVYIAKQFGDLA
jgi:nitrate reductase gamma subunit